MDRTILREVLSSQFKITRQHSRLSQEKMSERLNISPRSYSDLERGRSLCSMPVFVRFVLACCGEEKILGLFREMRRRLEGREDG